VVAAAVGYPVSNDAQYVTGTVMNVSGGVVLD
jgi:NAD(P)-dependent dehydrogenase (short-subunit alcohol dehydrogenase family)